MLGLEVFIVPRLHECSPDVDAYLEEIENTTYQVDWSGHHGWILCKEHAGGHLNWERWWRVWGGNYPNGWLKEIAYMDWGILTPDNFYRVPWVTVTRNLMPSRKAAYHFWWWLKKPRLS